ncbi:olfactory receptor 1361-like [Rhineura floridana]|uniref:olfactory receptor 1361-like n=1 Tax=Rhineura floridana TaxID=261503 RepID=UPI002AC7FE3C|nr:olfactory receptor 1361-like [Rhineura floridana]
MPSKNHTSNPEMVLLGISALPEHQSLLFLLFLFVYLLTLLGNLLIILLICFDDHLHHTPMYFFLSHLSLADAIFASTTVPKILSDLLSQTKTISFNGCLIQMYFFLTFGNIDNFILACMAYDRYVAICHPLHYTTVMSHKCCLLLASGSWIISTLHSLLYTLLVSHLSFCASWEIPYLFCDVYPLLELSCSDTRLIKILAQTEGVVDILGPFVLILISYIHIFCAIMKIPSTTRKWKTFSTCGSHLAVVVLFYGTISCLYFQPASAYSAQKGTIASLLYAVVIPMLNPFIYSLRNHNIKASVLRLLGKIRDVLRKNQEEA